MCCLFVFYLVFLCTPSEKSHLQSLIKRNLSRSLINLRGHEGSGPQRCQSDAFLIGSLTFYRSLDALIGVVERTKSSRLSATNEKRDFPMKNSIHYLHFDRGVALEADTVRTSSCRRDVQGVTASPSLLDTLENFINHRCFLYRRRLLSTNRIISRSPTFFSFCSDSCLIKMSQIILFS